jgi:pimeloyl-ACP methyl ester carboxylesterase
MQVHFEGAAFDYQTLRALAYTTFGGAEPGEVFVTIERIPEGDREAWHAEWSRTADRVAEQVDEALAAGSDATARDAALRAHTYYRTAEFFLPPDDPRRSPTYERSREAFRTALDRLPHPAERVAVPYEGTTLPGYLYRPADATAAEPLPTVVCLGGFDSLAEELYFLCGVPAALERGFAVYCFDGPGQGAPLREAGLTARPDWEAVVGSVLDHLVEREGVDADRIGVVGASFGGYYAPRAAAFDDRIAACVAFDHFFGGWHASAHEHPWLARAFLSAPDALVNALASLGARSVDGAWFLQQGKWVFGVESAADLQRALRAYSLSGVGREIDCPTLLLAGEDDHLVPVGLLEETVAELTCPTTVRRFGTETGAAEHCQVGNLRLASATVYDWLDERL